MRIRLQDVADRTGVSPSTVSRVMNNRPGVNERTRSLVTRMLAEMGHDSAPSARGVALGLVGLVVPELDNPIFPLFAETMQTTLAANGYTPLLCCATRDGVRESEYLQVLQAHDVAGIISVSGLLSDTEADHTPYVDLVGRGMPVVFINGFSPMVQAPFFSCNDREAATLAVRHLVSLGHERIGFMSGPKRYVPVQRKLEGYQSAMRALGRTTDPSWVAESVFSVEGGHAAARALLARGVTAIVAASDLMALGAVRAAEDAGCHVPGEVSVVGFDDSPFMAFTDPPMTTVRQPLRSMSEHAAWALLDQIGGRSAANHEFLFHPELVVRSSTAPPRGD